MHDGQDTAFYLAKGFDVVAVEANPELVAGARKRFSEEIKAGRLRLVEAAIAETKGTKPMAISDEKTIWSTLSPDFVERNESNRGTRFRYVDVSTLPFEEVLADVGIPYYLKVDIEGSDMLCVRALHQFATRPPYLSIESNVTSNHAPPRLIADEIQELRRLGYRRFKYINQRLHPQVRLPNPPREGEYVAVNFTIDHSGPFGEETGGRWLPAAAALVVGQQLGLRQNIGGYGGRWRHTKLGGAYVRTRKHLRHRSGHSWYDLHARLG